MSPEGKPGSHIILGQGVENLTFHSRGNPEYVIKFARQLYVFEQYLLDKNDNNLTKERFENNLEIVHQYFDEKFLPKTEIRSFHGVWFTQQKFLPVKNFVSSKNISENPQFKGQILNIIENAEKMHKETGYCIDWFGLNKINEMIKTLTLPDYWSIPNIVITKNGKLKIFDTGLYLDDNIKDNFLEINGKKIEKHPAFFKAFDEKICKVQLYMIEKGEEKILKAA